MRRLPFCILLAIVGSSYAELEREMRLLIFLLPYLIMVFATVRLLWNNLKKRKLFDENLLILLATAGAFAVHRYSEAVGAMLFFQIGKLLELISMSRTRKSIEKFMDIRPAVCQFKDQRRGDAGTAGRSESAAGYYYQAGGEDPRGCDRDTGEKYVRYQGADRRIGAEACEDRQSYLQRKYQLKWCAGSTGIEGVCRFDSIQNH
nr:hypothetical protein [Mediterraneibacter gnavus]